MSSLYWPLYHFEIKLLKRGGSNHNCVAALFSSCCCSTIMIRSFAALWAGGWVTQDALLFSALLEESGILPGILAPPCEKQAPYNIWSVDLRFFCTSLPRGFSSTPRPAQCAAHIPVFYCWLSMLKLWPIQFQFQWKMQENRWSSLLQNDVVDLCHICETSIWRSECKYFELWSTDTHVHGSIYVCVFYARLTLISMEAAKSRHRRNRRHPFLLQDESQKVGMGHGRWFAGARSYQRETSLAP